MGMQSMMSKYYAGRLRNFKDRTSAQAHVHTYLPWKEGSGRCYQDPTELALHSGF